MYKPSTKFLTLIFFIITTFGVGCGDDSSGDKCVPGETRCEGNAVVFCRHDGSGWSSPRYCEPIETCLESICVPIYCEPGEKLCASTTLLTCNEDGSSWTSEECPEGLVCVFEACRECVEDKGCGENEECMDGVCEPARLRIVTESLADGMVGGAYGLQLESKPACETGTWAIDSGSLPPGLNLSDSGEIHGTPTAEGEYAFVITLDCAHFETAYASYDIRIHPEGLLIVTDTLPQGMQGFEYYAELTALGGLEPYGWMVSEGSLPSGLFLTYDGVFMGAPDDVGDFPLTIKVFDDNDPPQMAWKDLLLVIGIAPLEIFGEDEYDLLVGKVIVLDMITVFPGIPIPYSTQLQARGGLKPYYWIETDLPAGMNFIIPESGIPDGLTLEEDGSLHGSVTSTEQVITVSVPFSDIEITGFFFAAQVSDAQDPPDIDTAAFVIPTLPIGG